MKYIEINAKYRVKIPDNYEFSNDKRFRNGHTIEEYRQYWNGKYITVIPPLGNRPPWRARGLQPALVEAVERARRNDRIDGRHQAVAGRI